MHKLTIGIIDSPWFIREANRISSLLQETGIETALVQKEINLASSLEFFPATSSLSLHQLLQSMNKWMAAGVIDIFPFPLHLLPFDPASTSVPTALLPRIAAHDTLLIRQDSLDTSEDFGLKKGAKVCVWSNIQAAQLKFERKDLQIQIIHDQDPLFEINLMDESMDAYLIPGEAITSGLDILDGCMVRPLVQSECTPVAGQGTTAMMVLPDNLMVRKMLKPIHHTATATFTNIERSVTKALSPDRPFHTGAHCTLNEDNYYSIWVKSINRETLDMATYQTVSQTKAGLAELAIDHFLKS